MSNYSTGHDSEKMAASYLEKYGYVVRELNWKTKYCEIDIVAERNKRIYFVEVKSRLTDKQGLGIEYITPKKLRQMMFAAEMWVSNNNWSGEYQLAAISIDGGNITFLDEL